MKKKNYSFETKVVGKRKDTGNGTANTVRSDYGRVMTEVNFVHQTDLYEDLRGKDRNKVYMSKREAINKELDNILRLLKANKRPKGIGRGSKKLQWLVEVCDLSFTRPIINNKEEHIWNYFLHPTLCSILCLLEEDEVQMFKKEKKKPVSFNQYLQYLRNNPLGSPVSQSGLDWEETSRKYVHLSEFGIHLPTKPLKQEYKKKEYPKKDESQANGVKNSELNQLFKDFKKFEELEKKKEQEKKNKEEDK